MTPDLWGLELGKGYRSELMGVPADRSGQAFRSYCAGVNRRAGIRFNP